MNNNWDILLSKDIIQIIIGDTVIKNELFKEYRMPYLSGPLIFKLASDFSCELSYDVGPNLSRWQYMQKLIKYCIENNSINKLLIELISLKRFKDILKDLESNQIIATHNELVWAFIQKINNILIFDNYILEYNGKNFNISTFDERYTNEVKSEQTIEFSKIITEFCQEVKESNQLVTKYGVITEIKDSGKQGGNGKILFGNLNKHNVAIKILYNDNKDKHNRFFAEFINVLMSLQKEKGVVELYLIDTIKYKNVNINYIVMKRYNGHLEMLKENKGEQKVVKLFYDLCEIIKKIHDENIIHRDIKPENILIDDNENIVLSDFGIAYFNPDNYENTGHTIGKDILGNRRFSSPEQGEKNAVPHPTMDIFALGQIVQWYVTGRTHFGTEREKLNLHINTPMIEKLDIIINKCLSHNPLKRYQNIEEIYIDLKKYNIVLNEEPKDDKVIFNNEIEENYSKLDYGEQLIII